MDNLDVAELLRDLGLDLGALFILAYLGYFLRHRRWDQLVSYVAFNISLFTVATALGAAGPLNIGVGFGLFGVLSIVRLRSGESGHIDIGYTMVSLVLGLMTGLSGMDFGIKLIFSALLVLTMLIIDFGGDRQVQRWSRIRVELDRVIVETDDLAEYLEGRLGAPVVRLHVRNLDYVRDTMSIDVVVDRRPSSSRVLDA